MASNVRIVEQSWNPKQSRFILSRSKRLNLEGGVRAGKTWALCYKVWKYAQDYPGIQIALVRWGSDTLDAQLKPEWRRMCRRLGVEPVWNPAEEYDEFPNESLVYLRALRTSEDSQRYSRLAGLTLAIFAADQAEEIEEDVYRHYVPARLSQPGYPHAVWITPNPPLPDSWSARDWPEDGSNPGFELIHTTPYDNKVNLGQEYIDELEAAYPPDSLEYRRLIAGKRGLMVAGEPIYARHFKERRHVGDEGEAHVELDPYVSLHESWDFGTLRPCVVWGQYPAGGRMHLLGGVMGDRTALEAFIPVVQEIRAQWFPTLNPAMLYWTSDPAGQAANSHGSQTAVSILHGFGIYPTIHENANDPRIRAGAIQTTIGYLMRTAHDGTPLFRLNPRFVIVSEKGRQQIPVLQQVFEGGYVYDSKRSYQGTQYHGIRPPRKDGFYEHPANATEYLSVAFAPANAAELAGLVRNPMAEKRAREVLRASGIAVDERKISELAGEIVMGRAEQLRARAERMALQKAQMDHDEPFDRLRRESMPSAATRGGYVRTRPWR